MDHFRKNIPQTDFEGKKSCNYVSGEKISYTERKYRSWHIMLKKKILHRYMLGKKNLTPEVWRKILTQIKSPIPRLISQMVYPLVNDIHQQNGGARSSCGDFQDQSFAFQD